MVATPSNLTLWNPGNPLPSGNTQKQEPRFSNHAFQSLWENSIDGLALTDSDGIFVNVNQGYCQIFGKSKDELIGQPFYVVWDGGERAQRLQDAYKKRFAANKLETHVERRLKLWSSEQIDIEASGSFVESDDGQKLLLTVIRNITRRKQAEASLRRSEKRFHDIFDNAVQGMFQSTPDGHLIAANPALLKLLGYSTFEEMAAVNMSSVYVNAEDRMMLGELLKAKGYCSNIELQLKRKDGKVITVCEHSRAIKNEFGEVVEYEGIIEDMTVRKALEKKLDQYLTALKASEDSLKTLNAQKDKLFSILSHDLRSPFSSIIGFTKILQEERETLSEEEQIEFLGFIRQAAEQQLGLVNKLLDWSRFETGRVTVDMKEIKLETIVQKSIDGVQGIAKPKNIHLSSTLRPNLISRGDEQMLMQVFSNLVSNALKFTPHGGSITVNLAEETNDAWVVGVNDTGAGIPKQDLKKLFKVEEKYTREGLDGEKGTGLGLPVVYEIVQKHSGSITVESEEGKGTTFFVRLPKYSAVEGVKVMVVDDENGVRTLHSRYVKRAVPDATVIYAANGEEALELARKYHPTVVVSDYAMPKMDGFEFLTALKKDENLKAIPVLIITGEDSAASKDALRIAGAQAVLSKPIAPEKLEEVLLQALCQTKQKAQ
ncbi:MAG: PAS domain S-box protein [Ignavibacteriae bacterium]|nr:PAS domain S-box protein [Ignavibacteriota bacterium]